MKTITRLELFWISTTLIMASPALTYAGDYAYSVNGDGITCTIREYTGSGGPVSIPYKLDGYFVTRIDDFSFNGKDTVTSVAIPQTVSTIGNGAFASCVNVTGFYFQGDAPLLGGGAFNNDTATVYYQATKSGWENPKYGGLSVELLPFTYTSDSITITVQHYTGTNSVMTIPDTIEGLPVSCIYPYAFDASPANLTSVTIPGSVTNIADGAFMNCPSLQAVYFKGDPPNLEPSVFAGDTNAIVYYFPGYSGWTNETFGGCPTVLIPFTYEIQNRGITIKGYVGTNGAVTIPGTFINLPVTNIDIFAFYGNPYMTNVIVPDSVTTILEAAFQSCDNLTAITLSTNLSSIPSTGFMNCTNLTGVTIPDSVTVIGQSAFKGCSSLATAILSPSSRLNTIGDSAFQDCSPLSDVNFPGTLGYIGQYAFSGCYLSPGITIPDSVTGIGDYAFLYCTGITYLNLPSHLTGIGSGVFEWCTSLNRVVIPATVTYVGDNAFNMDINLWKVYFLGHAPSSMGSMIFDNAPATVYYLPSMTNWDTVVLDRTPVCWNPHALQNANLGKHSNQFGFDFSGNNGITVAVDRCTNLLNRAWCPVSTNTVSGGVANFSDPQSSNCPTCFYRFRAP